MLGLLQSISAFKLYKLEFYGVGRFLTVIYLVSFLPGELLAKFDEQSESAGITYNHASASALKKDHAGATAVDLNADGWPDLIALPYDQPALAYINRGNGSFENEASERGLGGLVGMAAVVAGDLDNDGDCDLVFAPADGSRFFLMMNDGTGQFSEEAVIRGAAVGVEGANHRGRSISLVDYDRDGFLDFYINERGVDAGVGDEWHSVLMRNRGTAEPAHFENVTREAGLLQPAAGDRHLGYSSAWVDFDGDGWPDLARVSDYGSSQIYWNRGDGSFIEATAMARLGRDEFGAGNAVADYDGDGLLDLLVTSIYNQAPVQYSQKGELGSGNKLYRYLGDRRFLESAAEAGVDDTGWGWGAAFFEYDNDGDPDLIVTNGWSSGADDESEVDFFPLAETDPTRLFVNDGRGKFADETEAAGISDRGQGRSIVVVDYDRDGDEDLLITQADAPPVIYRSDASTNGNHWLRLRFVGTRSNRDGIGAVVRVRTGDRTQVNLYNPTNGYMSQRESGLHFGLGKESAVVDSVEVTWPSDFVQTVMGLQADREHVIIEPSDMVLQTPRILKQPLGGVYHPGDSFTLAIESEGVPLPVYVWYKDGELLEGESEASLTRDHVHPFDAGDYTVTAINPEGSAVSTVASIEVVLDKKSGQSVARRWNEMLLEGIRVDFPDPTVHSRNLYHVSAAMWDAYWAYETEGERRVSRVFHGEKIEPASAAAQAEAISHAAFTVLKARYQKSAGTERTLSGFRWLMDELGYDPDAETVEGETPAAVGNRIGHAVLAAGRADGSNEVNRHEDTSGYVAANGPLNFEQPGIGIVHPNRWQPLSFKLSITQNDIVVGQETQTFLGVNWRAVQPFALDKPTPTSIPFDPGPPPLLGTPSADQFREAVLQVLRFSSQLDPTDGVVIDISPGAQLNNSLGSDAGTGYPENPITEKPYEPNLVLRADYGRLLAEFWADGPQSETPPGHWNTLLNQLVDDPRFEQRYMGVGPDLSPLEWEIRAYLALNGAMHDAAIAAWALKRKYDYVRPISMIRHLAGLGQSTDRDGPSYQQEGIPLGDGLVEVITAQSSAASERHAHLADYVGEIAVRAWQGEPVYPQREFGGVGWIRAAEWLPYQKRSFVSPAFGSYVSGHSTFSRAGAEVLTLLTGSSFFPGGLGEFHFDKSEYLEFEYGPSESVTMQWATFYDAADQAGISRLWGGIHVTVDDLEGRRLGSQIGLGAFLKAHRMLTGGLENPSLVSSDESVPSGVMLQTGIIGGETLEQEVTFELRSLEPALVLIRGIDSELKLSGADRSKLNPRLVLCQNLPDGRKRVLAENENWRDDEFSSLAASAARMVEAEALSISSNDAAILRILQPGFYSVSLDSVDGSTGEALLEIYLVE